MTVLAKIEANRRNAQLSTGPRTAEGRAAVAGNATRHGIFASAPVVPGERADEWEAHRVGVVESLAPVGLLEVNLAERAALLLWRLQRLTKYEADTIAAGMEDAEVPPLASPPDPFSASVSHNQPTREQQLRDIRRELRAARRELAEVIPARDFFTTDAVAPFAVAERLLEAACGKAETAENVRSDPPAFASKGFMRKIGLTGVDPRSVAWTTDLIRRGVYFYAGVAEESAESFAEGVRADLEEWAEELSRRVCKLDREANAVARFLDTRTDRRRAAKLLPVSGHDERIAKYERHLHNLLTSTLHELERLQTRRTDEPVSPPVVADVTVSESHESG